MYRATMTAIARGEVLGVREEGIRLREFVEKRYWPTVKPPSPPGPLARRDGGPGENLGRRLPRFSEPQAPRRAPARQGPGLIAGSVQERRMHGSRRLG